MAMFFTTFTSTGSAGEISAPLVKSGDRVQTVLGIDPVLGLGDFTAVFDPFIPRDGVIVRPSAGGAINVLAIVIRST